MTLRSNISHSEGQVGKPTEPTEIAVIIPVEDATRTMFFHQAVLSVQDDDGKTIAAINGAGGLGSDLITFEYEHSDGERRSGGFHLAPVLADWIEEADPKAPAALLKLLRGQA